MAIDRKHPLLIVLLIDQSGSMAEPVDGNRTKAMMTCDTVNRFIYNIAFKSTQGNEIRNYFYIAALGYSSSVKPLFQNLNQVPGESWAPFSIEEISRKPLRVDQRMKDNGLGEVTKVMTPVWIDPVADGTTKMTEAFRRASDIIQTWIGSHEDCEAPMVVNITDGDSRDGSPKEIANHIAAMRARGTTPSPSPRVLNIHICPEKRSIAFPKEAEGLPNEFASMLFDMSTPLSDDMVDYGNDKYDMRIEKGAKAFVFNADPTMVIMALDIGTKNKVEENR